jgi:long-subunit fatty acid transport protein
VSYKLRRLLPALAILALAPRVDATNGPKLTAYGARAAGRGGVDYAYADDAIGPATNPAGMAFVFGNRIDQTWAFVDPRVSWSNSLGKTKDKDDIFAPVPAFSFGVTLDPTKSWEIGNLFDLGRWGLDDPPDPGMEELTEEEFELGSKVRIGFGIFPITGGKIQLKKMRTSVFNDPLDWEVDTLGLAVTPSFAYRFSRWISFGLNMQLQYTKFELDGGIAQPRSTLSDDFEFAAVLINNSPQLFTKADLDDAFTYGFCWRAGLMFNFDKAPIPVSLGLVYQDRTYSADYLGRANVNATDEVNNLTQGNPALLQVVDSRIDPTRGFVSNYDLRIKHYEFPRMAGIGVAFRPHRRFSVGLDYTYIGYKETFKTFRVRLSGGDNPNLDIMTSPTIPVRVPLNFRDQHVLALGVTGLVAEGQDIVEGVPAWGLVLRAGYNYGRSPVPRRTTLPQLPVINEHHMSCGLSFLWGPLVELTASFEYQLPKEYEVGFHLGDRSLSNSKQECEILFFQVGVGARF